MITLFEAENETVLGIGSVSNRDSVLDKILNEM